MSLKILVNNEEVVCNNNLQIKEEMLSTSSTILKNCYPKTWEATKDYVSNYYFPKDYSKCKIIEETEINYEIVGSTTQDGTPTPSSPIPVVSKAGNITETIEGIQYNFSLGDVELCKIGNYEDKIFKTSGKNLFNKNGDFTYGDGENNTSLNADGQVVSTSNYSNVRSKGQLINVEPHKTYTLFGVVISANGTNNDNVVIRILNANNQNVSNLYIQKTTEKPYLFRLNFSTGNNSQILISLNGNNSSASGDTITVFDYLQLQKGEPLLYDYEPYGSVGEWYLKKYITQTNLVDYKDKGWWISGSTIKINWSTLGENKFLPPYTSSNPGAMLSTHFQNASASSLYNGSTAVGCGIGTDGFYFSNNGWSLQDFDDFLTDNEIYIYNVLRYPTYTKITNSTLLEQLESVGQKLLFCGCVKNTGNINLSPTEPHFVDLQVLDFKTLLSEGETLNYVITGKTIVEAINQVVNSISDYGFIAGNIQILNPNDVINAYSTLDKTPYDVFQYIADITQSRWTTRMVDENTVAIDFYDPTLMPEADPIENTQEYMCQNKIDDISFSYSTNDYRNKQIMTSDEIIANITQTETIVADGYATSFMCQNKIGTITNMKVNGVNATFITKNEEELGLTATFVYQPGNSSFESSSTILSGSVITITYYPIVKGREIILNSGESTRISTQIGRNGNISRYENRQDATSSAELQKIGQSYIKYKGKAQINLKVKTEKDLFDVGQIVEYQAPLEELSTDYMVKSKTIDWYVNVDKIFYTYELTSNYNYEDAINFFDNQRAKSKGNIGEGQTISRNIDLESTALILFYDTDVEEVEILNPTSLDFALDGVII